MSPKSIVLVQAGNDSLPRLRARLEEKGYSVVQAMDAPTAMDIVNRSEIALVITELYLRVGTCRCLARVMGKSPALRRTKLLAYTSHGKRKDRDWARRIGADGYVKKRSGEERFFSVVDHLMTTGSTPRRYRNEFRNGNRHGSG
ncbi:MAG TPA: response regulator [Gemmatimonadaceae bacterium]|nr:response regulator [Gemmatimonadaceae bacterium]